MKKLSKISLIMILPLLLGGCAFLFPSYVDNQSVYSISLDHSKKLIGINQSSEIKATAYTINKDLATNQTFNWNTSKEGIIELEIYDNYVSFTAKSVGTVSLKCSSKENEKAFTTCEIEVTNEYVPQTMSLNETYKDYTKNNLFQISSAPTLNKAKFLIIPVWFTDSARYITSELYRRNVVNDIKTAYLGSEKDTGWHSVKSFYETESRGALNIDGFVTDWFNTNQNSTEYYKENEDSSKTSSLVRRAFAWYKEKYGSSNITDFDTDKDGYIDSIMLIYAAPDYRTMNNQNASNLWAYCYWAESLPNLLSPNVNVFFWASYDFMYSQGTALIRTGSRYGKGDTTIAKIDAHCYIHEMGHVFGAEDYYDYSQQYNPAGGFSMQDLNVGAHDPFTRLAYGWEKPYVPTQSCKMTVSTYENSGDLVLLSQNPNSFSKSPFDEYLLLELYSPTGLNEFDHIHPYLQKYPIGASETGFRIWHVDARLLDLEGIRDESEITTDRIVRGIGDSKEVRHAMSNTYYDENDERSISYISLLGPDYADYNILQLIRNSKFENYHPTDDLSNVSLFRQGSTFNFDLMYKQFVNSYAMNDGNSFPWTIKVDSISNGSATITLTYNQ